MTTANFQMNLIQANLDEHSDITKSESTFYSEPWLTNSNMTSPIEPTWYSTVGGADTTGIDAMDGQGMANVTVVGDSGVVSIEEDHDSWTPSNWYTKQNPSFPVEPTYEINAHGAGISYTWDENTDQTGNAPCGLYKRQYDVGKDLSNYSITSASIQAEINGSVGANVEAPSEGGGQFAVGDIIRWYILLSDDTGATSYEIAWNQSWSLGDGAILTAPDTVMNNVSNSILGVFLESIFDQDKTSVNITLGIQIICEDNAAAYDVDTFNHLYFTSFNLTFTYAKEISETTYAGWSQQGNTLPQGNVVVDAATLDLQYRLQSGQVWPGTSQNSRIQMQINNISHSEFIHLTDANSTWQAGSFDVTTLIPKSQNITLSLQVYLADTFDNYNNVTISFDNVYLQINYTVTVTGPTLSVSANTSLLYTNQYTQLTVNCENATAGNVSHLIMYDPIASANSTLDTNFNGPQTYFIDRTSASPGAYLFKFWANSSAGITSYEEIYIVWTTPVAPILTVTANATTLYTAETSQITVTCENGSERVDTLWYLDALTSTNITLATNFTGQLVFLRNKTSAVANPYVFKFWANSSLGMGIITEKEITIVWNDRLAPTLTVSANETNPYTGFTSRISVGVQQGSENTSLVWYTDGLDGQNYTLDSNFAGIRNYNVDVMSASAGSYEFIFYANSSLGPMSSKSITIFWKDPQDPYLMVITNTSNPFIDYVAQVTVTVQSTDGNIDQVIYYHAIDMTNYTLDSNFSGQRIYLLNFSTSNPGSYIFTFWVNSTFGLLVEESVTIVWITPQSPILSVDANITNPFINDYTQITIAAQSGSGDIDTLWYYNPLTTLNVTLDSNFAGQRIYLLNFTSATAGSNQFIFWANSTIGADAEESITIVWILPTAPIVTVNANTTTPYVDQATQLTVTAQSGTGNISVLWYYNALTLNNVTLDTNFAGSRSYYPEFTSAVPGAFEFKFWANSTVGLEVVETITIVWVAPTPPIITINSNDTTPYVDRGTQLIVTAQSGIGNISVLWYNNPFNGQNITLDSNFAGVRIHLLNFSSASPGSRTFQFWANSTFGLLTHESIDIIWIVAQPPILTVLANTTTPYTNQATQLNVTAQSGTGNVSVFWYYNPISMANVTLDTNFAGTSLQIIVQSSAVAGSYTFEFWANSSSGLESYESIIIIWIDPQAPLLTVTANTTTPYTDYATGLVIQAQSGSGNIDLLWYYNPLTMGNVTLDSNFAGQRIYLRNFTSAAAGSYQFTFWANSTFGLIAEESIIIIWVDPQAPILTVTANTTTPYTGDTVQLTVQAQSGSGNISMVWYYNPLTLNNVTLDSNFAGSRNYYPEFTSATAGSYQFIFWANSTFDLEVSDSITVIWVDPQPPILALTTNATVLEINQYSQINVTCQSGSFTVSRFWYYNGLTSSNVTLDTNFVGSRTHSLTFTSAIARSAQFIFWANSTRNLEETTFIIVLWVDPQPPAITVWANITNPYVNRATNITVQCQPGSGSVHTLWYYNPLDTQNHTLATGFSSGYVTFIVNTSATAGPYTYEFWANNSAGLEVTETLLIVWVTPQGPVLSTTFNATNIYPTQWTQINVTCIPGSAIISQLWYYNPIINQNITLGTNIVTSQTFTVDNTSFIPQTAIYTFYANSPLGGTVEKQVTIVWIVPTPPTIEMSLDPAAPEKGEDAVLIIKVTAGSGEVDAVWFYNPFTGQNETLINEVHITVKFFGEQTFRRTLNSPNAGTFEIIAWANSSYLAQSRETFTISWVEPSGVDPIPIIIGAIVAIGAIAAAALAYQFYFKVPKTVRAIRGLKKGIKAGNIQPEPMNVPKRQGMMDDMFQKKMSMKKLPQVKPDAPGIKVMKKPG